MGYRLLFSLCLIGSIFSATAQDDFDDLYYKSSKSQKTQQQAQVPNGTYRGSNQSTLYTGQYGGNSFDVDTYNRRGVMPNNIDTIVDSTAQSYFANSQNIERFDNPNLVTGSKDQELKTLYYDNPSSVNIYINGGWAYDYSSPWYYSRWYPYTWAYDPWYYGGWYSYPWRYGWYSSWYGPRWYDPWYGYGWYDTWYYNYGWGYYRPYYYTSGYYAHEYNGGGRRPSGYGVGTNNRYSGYAASTSSGYSRRPNGSAGAYSTNNGSGAPRTYSGYNQHRGAYSGYATTTPSTSGTVNRNYNSSNYNTGRRGSSGYATGSGTYTTGRNYNYTKPSTSNYGRTTNRRSGYATYSTPSNNTRSQSTPTYNSNSYNSSRSNSSWSNSSGRASSSGSFGGGGFSGGSRSGGGGGGGHRR